MSCRFHVIQKNWLLYLFFFIAVVPVLFLRDYTPANELRYLSIADEALRHHSFFTFTNHGEVYADKPPLYFWFIMSLKMLLGSYQMWALGLASLLPALATVHTMDRWVLTTLDRGIRSCASMCLLTCAFFLGAALTLRMDMLMCWFIVLSLRSFWHIYLRDASYHRAQWTFGLFVFLALFTKGPLGVLIPLCATFAFLCVKRQMFRWSDLWGWRTLTILSVGCFLWFGAVVIEGGWSYLDNLLFHQTFDRAVNAFHHSRPFYYYLVCLWYCVAPWSPLTVLSVGLLLRHKSNVSDLGVFFAITALVIILLLSSISGKLQIYMLPAIPFMVYSAALCLPAYSRSRWVRLCVAFPAFLLVATFPVVLWARAAYVLAYLSHPAILVAAALLTLGGVCALLALLAGPSERSTVVAMKHLSQAVMAAVFAASFALPKLNDRIGYGKLCEAAADVARHAGLHDFRAFDMKNAADMDVYLQRPIESVSDSMAVSKSLREPVLLMMPCQYREWAHGYQSEQVGDYLVVLGRCGK